MTALTSRARPRLAFRAASNRDQSMTAMVGGGAGGGWRVLVVDDDPEIHQMTRIVLRDFAFQGQGFQMLSAYDGVQARQILRDNPDIPVMLLDVVMETPEAGLSLARFVREDLHNRSIRIILRTGHPGDVPEHQVMADYDINDYRDKSELTAQRLYSTLVAAIRSWSHIATIHSLNETLEARVAERTRQLSEATAFAEALLESLPQPMWYEDEDGQRCLCNRAFRQVFGMAGECGHDCVPEHCRRTPQLAVSAEGLDGQGGRVSYETTVSLADGRILTMMVCKGDLRLPDGRVQGVVGMLTDITERKALEQELRHLATTDPLTGACNRRYFMSVLGQEIERSARHGSPVSVIMLDLDHFKAINDSHGHATGDKVLIETVNTCQANLRETDLLGRMGGEEFAVLLRGTDHAGAMGLAERLCQAIRDLHIVAPDGGRIPVRASLGVAQHERGDWSLDRLLSRADHALYQAKAAGRDQVVSNPV